MATIVRVGGGGFSRKINADTGNDAKTTYTFSSACDAAVILMHWHKYGGSPTEGYTITNNVSLENIIGSFYNFDNEKYRYRVYLAKNVPSGTVIKMSGNAVNLKVATIKDPLTQMNVLGTDIDGSNTKSKSVSADTPCAIYGFAFEKYGGRPTEEFTQSEGSCVMLAHDSAMGGNDKTIYSVWLEDNAPSGKTMTLQGNGLDVKIARLD